MHLTAKLALMSLLLFVCCPSVTLAQGQCNSASTLYSAVVAEAGKSACCSKKSAKKRKKCFRSKIRGVKSAAKLLSKQWTKDVSSRLREAIVGGCSEPATLDGQVCTEEEGVTVVEALTRVENAACGLKFKDARQKRLQSLKRSLKKVRGLVSREFTTRVKRGIRKLKRSKACGSGGEEGATGCASVVDPRDGINTGNVYKLGDHDGLPVFITHNGARNGSAIDQNGQVLDTLRYTGLANPDPQGLRHHYRLSRSCGSLPTGYMIKLGGTCYRIDNPCGRID